MNDQIEQWTLLKTNQLFSHRDTIQEAMQYIDDIFEQIPAGDSNRMYAYTGVYLLYNTVVKYYNKQIQDHNEDCYL
jgi:hypothetical protein